MKYLLIALALIVPAFAQEATSEVKNVDAAAAKALLAPDAKAITVLDVRTPAEYKAGHIAGAKNIDFKADTFAAELAKLNKATTYLVHCRSGGRSTASLETFKKLGFKAIYHLDGGMIAWEKSGGAVEKP